MKRCRYYLYNEKEYTHNDYGFIPFIEAYLHENNKHNAILICPGGGYNMVSSCESYSVALEYYNAGYDAYVLVYTTNCYNLCKEVKKQALQDAKNAMQIIRKMNKNKIAVIGFSAGGHLAASLSLYFDNLMQRPDALILAYPVISSGIYAHKGSFKALYNDENKEDLEFFSLEHHVKENCPPVFIWHTKDDDAVPVENTLLFKSSCDNKNVYCEMHLYKNGRHGLSLADGSLYEVGDSYYVIDQLHKKLICMQKEKPNCLYDKFENYSLEEFYNFTLQFNKKEDIVFPKDVSSWVKLSKDFLTKVLDTNNNIV